MNNFKKKILTIGGGSRKFALLSGLRDIEEIEITSIVSVIDSCGTTGRLGKKIFKYLSLICIFCLIILSCSNKNKHQELKANIIAPAQEHIEIMEGEKVYFQSTVYGGDPPYKFNWDFGTVAPPSSEKSPGEIVFNWPGAYKVLLTVRDSKHNINTDFVMITVEEDIYGIKPANGL